MDEGKELVLDDASVNLLSEAVAKVLLPKLSEDVMKKLEDVDKKLDKKLKESEEQEDSLAPTKQLRFMKACIALVKGGMGGMETVKEFNMKALELRAKSGFNNAATSADGGYIVMDPEFETEIEKLALDYGVAFSEASVRQTDRSSIKTNKRGSNVIMYEVSEGATKTASKMTVERVLVELREFAGIAIATDQLVEDAAVDFWQDVIDGFAEEMARWADILVFTDRTAGKEGILHIDGTQAITVGATISLVTWDDLLDAEVSVPTKAFKNGKFYMHRTVWNIVRKSKNTDGAYMWMPQMGLQTPWGTPVVLVDVMPSSTEVGDANEPYIVFGDLKRIRLYTKRGMEFLQSQHAVVTDSESVSKNMFTQDMTALRATVRMVAMIKFPEAFCVIGTGTVS